MAFANTDPWNVVPFFGCRAWSYNHRMKRIHSTIGSKFRFNCLLFRVLKVHGLCLLYSKGNPFLPSNTKQIQIKTITANPWYKKLNLTVHINVILSEFLKKFYKSCDALFILCPSSVYYVPYRVRLFFTISRIFLVSGTIKWRQRYIM